MSKCCYPFHRHNSDATASGDLPVSDVSTRDVTEVTDKAGGDLASSEGPLTPAPRTANIYYLDTDLLKLVLSKLECRHMFQARQGKLQWRAVLTKLDDRQCFTPGKVSLRHWQALVTVLMVW